MRHVLRFSRSESLTSHTGLFAGIVLRVSRSSGYRVLIPQFTLEKCGSAFDRHLARAVCAKVVNVTSTSGHFLASEVKKLDSCSRIGVFISCVRAPRMKTFIRSRPVSCYEDDGQTDERVCDEGRGARWEPGRKLLDHVDCFPSQPKWTYRLETSVLDVKIPVAAPVSKPPLYSPSSLFLSLPLFLFLSFRQLSAFSSHVWTRALSLSLPLFPFRLCSFVLDVNDAMGVDTVQQIRNPLFLDIKLRPFFRLRPSNIARLRAVTLCEQSIGATDKTEL